MSTYTHPSEGQPLATRILIAVLAIGFLLLACSVPKAEGASVPAPHFGGRCRIVVTDADHDTGKMARIAARHGGVDYTGARFGPGVWTLNDAVGYDVFGWSMEEDSIVYSTRSCALRRPLYVS